MKIVSDQPTREPGLLPKPMSEMSRAELVEALERLRGARELSKSSPARSGGTKRAPAQPVPFDISNVREEDIG